MFVVTSAEMREYDRRTIMDKGVPGPVLMERAGWGVYRELTRRFGSLNQRRVVIVCGKGNNGGDGLVLARLLHDGGFNPRVFVTDPPEEIAGDAALMIPPLRSRRVPLETIPEDPAAVFGRLTENDIIIDAILGTGFRGAIAGSKASLINAINRSSARVVAVDIPSGLSADTGQVAGPAVRAHLTVTMAFPKWSFMFWPAREMVGEWSVVDIGIPADMVDVEETR